MSELRRLNYSQNQKKGKLTIDQSEIPNLIPSNILKDWQKDDTEPYYKIQEIEYPIKANRINYLESFFESFIAKLKDRPIPGNKNGHNFWSSHRAPTDFIMVGAKIVKNSDGAGKVYFKNYIPPKGATGDNEVFIRENKSDMIHYSLVSYTKDEIIQDDEGITINVIGSIKGERNDAVEYGLGAMEQKTNEEIEWLKDHNIKYILDEPETGKENKGEAMTKEEILEKLKTLKANAEITLLDIATALELSSQIITDEHTEALKVVNALSEAGIKNPVEDITKLQEQIKANSQTVRNAELDKAFGNDADKKNYLRQYAEKQAGDLDGKDLEKKINEIKDDPIAKQLARDRADYTTDTNTIGSVEQSNNDNADTNDSIGGVRVVRVDRV